MDVVRARETRAPNHKLCARITRRCLELGLSMNITAHKGTASVWRIAPPLTVTEAEIDEGLTILDQATRECLSARRG